MTRIKISRIKFILNKFFLDINEKNFIKHNRKIFINNSNKNKSIGLIELNESSGNLIPYSYMVSILAKKYDSSIYAFFPRIPRTFYKRQLWAFRRVFGFKTVTLFKSFGVDRLIVPSLTKSMKREAKDIFDIKINSIKTKDDLENLTVFGIIFGDLIYDYYLNFYKKSEIDLSSIIFKQHLRICIEFIVFWRIYIKSNNISVVSVSHTVYSNAIPIRIAIKLGIPSFQCTIKDIYRLSINRPHAYTEFKDFRKIFNTLSEDNKIKGIKMARERVEERFSGKVGVDMSYSKKSAFGNQLQYRLIKKSPNKKILIAPHCFFDSPHPYGNNLFTDVLEWLNELVEISKKTNYDWYVKTHPDFIDETKKVVEGFFKDLPNFTILPSDSSHNQIIDEGIDFALTIYGTIGFEYAAKNIPVINASNNAPTIAYDFNINPKSRADFRDLMMNLDIVDHSIVLEDVYEYYFMKNLYYSSSWLFNEYDEMIDYVGGYYGQFTPLIYKYWLKNWDLEIHNKILSNLDIFMNSNGYKFDIKNLHGLN